MFYKTLAALKGSIRFVFAGIGGVKGKGFRDLSRLPRTWRISEAPWRSALHLRGLRTARSGIGQPCMNVQMLGPQA